MMFGNGMSMFGANSGGGPSVGAGGTGQTASRNALSQLGTMAFGASRMSRFGNKSRFANFGSQQMAPRPFDGPPSNPQGPNTASGAIGGQPPGMKPLGLVPSGGILGPPPMMPSTGGPDQLSPMQPIGGPSMGGNMMPPGNPIPYGNPAPANGLMSGPTGNPYLDMMNQKKYQPSNPYATGNAVSDHSMMSPPPMRMTGY